MPRVRSQESASQGVTILRRLLDSRPIQCGVLVGCPTEQGVYALWLADEPPVCLKVGIAGPRRGKGLAERLRLHCRSNRGNSVLARHLAADLSSTWTHGYDFSRRSERRVFLARRCYFRVVPVPGASRQGLLALEEFLCSQLRPRYIGRVPQNRVICSGPEVRRRV